MKRSKFTEHQIVKILKEAEVGVSVTDLSPNMGSEKAPSIIRISQNSGTL